MLKLFPANRSNCERRSRREFLLEAGAIAPLGLTLPMLLRSQSSGQSPDTATKNCILIWTRGGTSHHDTFDPKPAASAEVRGEFGFIDTALPGIQFTDQVPTFAKELKRFALLRSLNPRNGSHGTADAIMLSGHVPRPRPSGAHALLPHLRKRNPH